eukprot:COSAG02_NODE_389_length_23251_cov_259.067640_1_plen_733_part_00
MSTLMRILLAQYTAAAVSHASTSMLGAASRRGHEAAPGHGVCVFHNDSQLFDPGGKYTKSPVTAHSAQECCDICGRADECQGAVLYGLGCFVKTKKLPIVPQKPPPGVTLVACVYQRWSPLPGPPVPPSPPPAPPPVPGPPGPPEGSGGPYFPRFHPRMHTAHNNDVNGPFFFNGYYHIFMQQSFPWVKGWNGAIGWGHMVSPDLAHWREISSFTGCIDAFVPGRWHDPQYGVPAGGYYSGSVTIVKGIPHAVFPAYFIDGPCVDPWLPGHEKNRCQMVYQYSTPTNLSDPFLANWTQPRSFVWPKQGVQPHDITFEDPSAAWQDPTTPGRWVFIGQTNDQKGVLLEGWASKNGSDWSAGFESLGNFFPSTGDSRCSIPTGCGYFTPSFANGVAFRGGYHLLWGGNNQYWLGHYLTSPSDAGTNSTNNTNGFLRLHGRQIFVPVTVPQGFDGPESSCAKGFFDVETKRYLLWFWVSPAGDGKFVTPIWKWDGMISLPRHLDIDLDLLQITLYPVEELNLLRVTPPLAHLEGSTIAQGSTPLAGVHGNALDVEVIFDWSHTRSGQIPTVPGIELGLAVLVGEYEQTLVTFKTGGTRFNNGTRRDSPAAVLAIDTRHSRAGDKTGSLTTTPVILKPGETNLTLRLLVDMSVVEAFAMGGRASMIRRVYPKQFNTSLGMALVYDASHVAAATSSSIVEQDYVRAPERVAQQHAKPNAPLVTLTVWQMRSAYLLEE